MLVLESTKSSPNHEICNDGKASEFTAKLMITHSLARLG